MWTLFIEDKFIGRAQSPTELSSIFSVNYLCQHCGESYAKKIQSPHKLWYFYAGICRACAKTHPALEPQRFLTPADLNAGFLPPAVLAAEFLFNCDLFLEFPNDRTYRYRHQGSDSRPENPPHG